MICANVPHKVDRENFLIYHGIGKSKNKKFGHTYTKKRYTIYQGKVRNYFSLEQTKGPSMYFQAKYVS